VPLQRQQRHAPRLHRRDAHLHVPAHRQRERQRLPLLDHVARAGLRFRVDEHRRHVVKVRAEEREQRLGRMLRADDVRPEPLPLQRTDPL
jgi:hypothetical protein